MTVSLVKVAASTAEQIIEMAERGCVSCVKHGDPHLQLWCVRYGGEYCEALTAFLDKLCAPAAEQILEMAELVRVAGTHVGPMVPTSNCREAGAAVSIVRL